MTPNKKKEIRKYLKGFKFNFEKSIFCEKNKYESLRKKCLIDLNEPIVIPESVNIFEFFNHKDLLINKSKFGDWNVSKKGNMSYKRGRYFIDYYRLEEDEWIEHMSNKVWINMYDFIPAYFQALKNAGLQDIIDKLTK